jgi:hypothetical protein
MNSDQEAILFRLLDSYSRAHCDSFLAEMFMNSSKTEYNLCFRPTKARSDSSNLYDCRYLKVSANEASLASQKGELSQPIIQILQRDLLGHGS